VTATGEQVMVTLRPAPAALVAGTTRELEQAYRLRTVFSWTMASLGEQCIVFEVPRGHTLQEILRRLHSDPRVGSVQPIATFDTLAAPPSAPADTVYNDPYAHLQHSVQALHLGQAHRWATGKGIRIAVIDTGADLDHPDLRGRIVKANSFVDRGEQTFTTDIHGTAVAGVIAAATNNQVGIVGVAPQAELYALKACWQKAPGQREAVCDSYTLAKAVDFAIVQGAQILNFSLGGPYDPLLARLINTALAKGIIVVAADAGDSAHSFPASLQGVLGIQGIDDLRGERRARAPARNGIDEVGAPAVDILTTVPHGSYDFFTGSSFAAAQVSGIVALLLEREPKMTAPQIAALLRKTARSVPEPPGAPAPPLTQVDACAALAVALGTGACP
jgi:subtilisin family serine protease